MKSLSAIDKEINEIIKLIEHEKAHSVEQKPVVVKRRMKRIQLLRLCKKYLQSEPTQDFLLKEQGRIENRMGAIELSYDVKIIDLKLKYDTKGRGRSGLQIRKEYNKVMGVPELKEQLKTIRFILN